jgi:hypothetical protein
MDKRINLVNILKNQLNKLVTSGKKYSKSNQTSGNRCTNLSNIRALLLSENIQLGIAINEKSLEKSEIYSEMSANGGLKFHVYPQNLEKETSQEPGEEVSKEKTNSAPIQ